MEFGHKTLRVGRKTVRAGRKTVRAGRKTVRAGHKTVRAGRKTVRAGRKTVRVDVRHLAIGDDEETLDRRYPQLVIVKHRTQYVHQGAVLIDHEHDADPINVRRQRVQHRFRHLAVNHGTMSLRRIAARFL